MTERYPIFVPLEEIDLQQDPFERAEKEGNITLTPKNGVLHGFRCKENDDWRAHYEVCGPIEPRPFLQGLCCAARYRGGWNMVVQKFGQTWMGGVNPQRIDCIALIPEDDGAYTVIGNQGAGVEFLRGQVSLMTNPDDIAGIELKAYAAMPSYRYEGIVELTDCTEKELIEKLLKLTRK